MTARLWVGVVGGPLGQRGQAAGSPGRLQSRIGAEEDEEGSRSIVNLEEQVGRSDGPGGGS